MSMSESEGHQSIRLCPHCGKAVDEPLLRQKQYCCPVCGSEVAHRDIGPNGQVRGVIAYLKGAGELLNDRYRIVRILGKGGFAATYLAEDLKLEGKRRALKEIPAQFFDVGEVELLALLRHPAIPDVMDRFSSDGMVYLVLQFGGSATLASRCKELGGRVPLVTALPWMRQLCQILTYLHSQTPPVIHRDLKPENVLLDDHNNVTLIDFGIAKVAAPAAATRMLGRACSHGFSPPEQVLGLGTEVKSDVYSWGATCYYLLTGQIPPPAHERLAGRELQPPTALIPELPAALDEILLGSLHLNVEQRPASTAELTSMVENLEGGSSSTSPQTVRTVLLDQDPRTALKAHQPPSLRGITLTEPPAIPARPQGAFSSRKRAVVFLVAILVALTAVLAGGSHFLSIWRKPAPKPAPVIAAETFTFNQPAATATLKTNTTIYRDPNLKDEAEGQRSPGTAAISGFIRDPTHRLVALQIKDPGALGAKSYISAEDLDELQQLDDNGGYVQTLLASSVFYPEGKVSARETMKSLDAYISRHLQDPLGALAIYDYLLCLDSLLRDDPAANKGTAVRLAEIYLARARERYPDSPWTKQSGTLVERLRTVTQTP